MSTKKLIGYYQINNNNKTLLKIMISKKLYAKLFNYACTI